MEKLSFGDVFTVLVKYGLFLHCSSLSCQGQESLLLAGLLAYQLAAELKGNLTAQWGFYKIYTIF